MVFEFFFLLKIEISHQIEPTHKGPVQSDGLRSRCTVQGG